MKTNINDTYEFPSYRQDQTWSRRQERLYCSVYWWSTRREIKSIRVLKGSICSSLLTGNFLFKCVNKWIIFTEYHYNISRWRMLMYFIDLRFACERLDKYYMRSKLVVQQIIQNGLQHFMKVQVWINVAEAETIQLFTGLWTQSNS